MVLLSFDETAPLQPHFHLELSAALVDFDNPVAKWHRRLGHLGLQNLRNLLKFSKGITLTDKQVKDKITSGWKCPVCQVTRTLNIIP